MVSTADNSEKRFLNSIFSQNTIREYLLSQTQRRAAVVRNNLLKSFRVQAALKPSHKRFM